ncbi:type I-E CRISPR-associated protein Cas6/Cse3/CasE [Streptomyces olivochromogenes]|uniref:type I-E CRISPR-associated protein Cas6/Cse3/CasE n=1 Tax=Streptomyces olivochromogenes TaxID=1963 RepID=UPI001F3D8868|nr:type I-E CRISPR-associated protein Cas6/Cse3/CasE [Streptomyces olivochromogenes]MCF3132441.1 type I-E CRISPR-associated protein Cas6/Cse3/CasE [Streptomyces olivochromogenes]
MFLSRFRVNTARPGARRLLSSPQAMHAAVMSAFPSLLPSDTPDPDGPRVLWRLDHKARAEVLLYIVSPHRPDLTHLVEQAGWPTAAADPDTPGWQTRPYGPFLDRLATSDQWAFRLTANPVHTIRRKDSEPRKITAHLTSVHQFRWLLERQERCGFRILEKADHKRLLPSGTTNQGKHDHHGDRYELSVGDQRTLTFDKSRTANGNRQGKPVSLVTVTFDGRLEVTDPDALRRTLTHGIGRAKAYGCGLITLAPLNPATDRTR